MTKYFGKISGFVFSVLAATLAGVLLTFDAANAAGLQLGRDLYVGSTGADVQSLQQFLNNNGYTISSAGAGAPGHETVYFGALTRGALVRFQAANGLSQTGVIDSATRTALANYGGTTPGGNSIQSMIEVLKARISELQKQLAAILSGENNDTGNGPNIIALKAADGGDEGALDTKDFITITFDAPINPESINGDLDEGETVTGVASSTTGGVSISNSGKVTIKNIAQFDIGEVDDSGSFTSKIALNSTGKILTITLTSGSDVEITDEDFGSVTQLGGKVKDKDGNTMEEDEGVIDATGTFGGESDDDDEDSNEDLAIESVVVSNGGDDDYIDEGDYIKITFNREIDPESINDDLEAGDYVTGVAYSEPGGVSVSSVGRVTVKGILAFTAGEVDIDTTAQFSTKVALNSGGKVLTITLTDGDSIGIEDEDFMAAAQIGGVVEDDDGNEMDADSSIDDPTGTFGGNSVSDGDGPTIDSIVVADDDSEGYVSVGDTIKITFDDAIDPASVNDDLEEGETITGVDSAETGGVTISSAGKVVIKNIASFDLGSVDSSGSFDVSIELDDDGEVLTIALESGSDIEIISEDFSAAAQIGGTIENEDGDEMESDSSIDDPDGTFGGDNEGGTLSIDSIELDNGGDDDYLDEGDTITISFSDEIDPESINTDLEADGEVEDISYSKVGGVSISESSGKVTVKGIATFTFAEVDDSENYTVTLSLNDDADELTIEITDGDAVEIIDDEFDANTTQIGGYVENEDGDEMESDSSIDDPDGSF